MGTIISSGYIHHPGPSLAYIHSTVLGTSRLTLASTQSETKKEYARPEPEKEYAEPE
jgi:hypothetical protein